MRMYFNLGITRDKGCGAFSCFQVVFEQSGHSNLPQFIPQQSEGLNTETLISGQF